MNLEILEDSFNKKSIYVNEFPFKNIQAVTIKFEQHYDICLNKNSNLTTVEKKCILEHEHSHILTDAFYGTTTSTDTIKRRERKANDNMIVRLELVDPAINLIKQGLAKWEIADKLEITERVVDHIYNYIKRKNLI